MLDERGVTYTYRDYTKQPLDAAELRDVLDKLGVSAREVLRKRDAGPAGITGDEPEDVLIAAMAANNRLLQRPILVAGDRAVLGRPVENLVELL